VLEVKIEVLEATHEKLGVKIEASEATNKKLEATNKKLEATIEGLEATVKELEDKVQMANQAFMGDWVAIMTSATRFYWTWVAIYSPEYASTIVGTTGSPNLSPWMICPSRRTSI